MRNESGSAAVRLVFGLLIISVGVLFLLGNMGVINPHDYLRLWPALLIVLGLVQFVQPHRRGGYILGGVLVVVGAAMLLNRLYIIHFSFRDYWPLILIVVGAVMVLNHSIFFKGSGYSANSAENADSFLKVTSILSGFRRKCNSRNFRGGDLTAIMGGFEIDLRDADMDNEAVMDVFLLMGGGELRVPDNWLVVIECLPIMGGIEDKTCSGQKAEKRLVIRGTAVMGGMEIKN
jgi:predicted membrane protein